MHCIFVSGDNTPPSLTCPPNIQTTAVRLQTWAVVSWAEPTANDGRDGGITYEISEYLHLSPFIDCLYSNIYWGFLKLKATDYHTNCPNFNFIDQRGRGKHQGVTSVQEWPRLVTMLVIRVAIWRAALSLWQSMVVSYTCSLVNTLWHEKSA